MPCSSSGCLGQVVNNPEICVTSDRGDEVKVLLQANNATGLVVTKLNLLHYLSYKNISQTKCYKQSDITFQFSFHCSFRWCTLFCSLCCTAKPFGLGS